MSHRRRSGRVTGGAAESRVRTRRPRVRRTRGARMAGRPAEELRTEPLGPRCADRRPAKWAHKVLKKIERGPGAYVVPTLGRKVGAPGACP